MVVIVATREVKDGISTIAFASDSAQLDGFHHLTEKNKTATKIVKTEVLTIGCSGSYQNFVLLQEFVQIAKPPVQPNIVAVMGFFLSFNNWKYEQFDVSTDDSRFLIAFQDKIFRCEPENLVYEVEDFDAIGSGEDFARAALLLGTTTHQAVRVACKLSPTCSLPVQLVEHFC
jgi:hypothetical protein